MDLIIDLGQSGARIMIDSVITSNLSAKSTNKSLLETLNTVFSEIPSGSYENVYLSLTGVNGNVKNQREIGDLCHRFFKSKNVAVMDDGFAAFIGALDARNGVVLTLGSGVVAVSGNKGKFAHTDGKGSIFGDFGGGFWLGQSALRRAVATLDCRDNATELVELFKEELVQLDALDNKVGSEASLLCIKAAKTVVQGADRGVISAQRILESGAEHLATTVISAWNKVKNSSNNSPYIAFTGGLSKSNTYLRLIKERVSQQIECSFVEADADHLIGAQRAAQLFPEGVDPLFKWAHHN